VSLDFKWLAACEGCGLICKQESPDAYPPGPLYLGQEGRYRLALASMLMSFAFCAVMTVLTFQFWQEAWENNWRSESMWRARLWIPYAAMPVGLALLSLQYIAEIMKLVSGVNLPQVPALLAALIQNNSDLL
jgi:TRAP-type C4-dicarboxylate transport system permease small subunit